MKTDLNSIKYYPDRFYMCLDGFDTDNLTTFLSDLQIGQNQSIFIHEYYHYLTNITTYAGVRQFYINFCDRFNATTILASLAGLNAFPLNDNKLDSCKEIVEYWNSALEILHDDDIDYSVVEAAEKNQNKKFRIDSVEIVTEPMKIYGEIYPEGRSKVIIKTEGLLDIHKFYLTFGAIDEFFSSSIDEFLFENDLADIDHRTLGQRPFYPYMFLEELMDHYGIKRPSALEKIMLSYFALHSENPPVALIETLTKLKDGDYEVFQNNPEEYLRGQLQLENCYSSLLASLKKNIEQMRSQGRTHITQALLYFYDKFYIAKKMVESDFLFFIRPFFEISTDNKTTNTKQKFLLGFARILNLFTPPTILKDKTLLTVDKLTNFGEASSLILATYEIMESLKTNRIAKRPAYMKTKYSFGDNDPDCDTFEKFTPPPINGTVFKLALNEIGLYGLYLQELENRKSNGDKDGSAAPSTGSL